jgi:PHD/YefM family antitoxin component YafN of YafNO toxin-antitoxin module
MTKKSYSVAQFRGNLSDLAQQVHHKSEVVDVVCHNKPWVSVVSPGKGRLARFVDSPESASDEALARLKTLIDQASQGCSGRPVSLGEILDHLMNDQEQSDQDKQPPFLGHAASAVT